MVWVGWQVGFGDEIVRFLRQIHDHVLDMVETDVPLADFQQLIRINVGPIDVDLMGSSIVRSSTSCLFISVFITDTRRRFRK